MSDEMTMNEKIFDFGSENTSKKTKQKRKK